MTKIEQASVFVKEIVLNSLLIVHIQEVDITFILHSPQEKNHQFYLYLYICKEIPVKESSDIAFIL